MVEMQYQYTDSGYCRVNYTCKNHEGQTVSYCIMEEEIGRAELYRCSGDDWNEPQYMVKLDPNKEDEIIFERPDTEYGVQLLNWFMEGKKCQLKD